jgi:hypothetical protein
MEKRYEFIERSLYLLRKEMENNLPLEATLEEMLIELKKIINTLFK